MILLPAEPEERLGDGGRIWSWRLPWQLLHNLRTNKLFYCDKDDHDYDGAEDDCDEVALGDGTQSETSMHWIFG